MAAYIARRLVLAFFTVWVISVAAFVIIELPPGDTIDRMFDRTTRTHGEAVAMEMLEALRLRLGLDEPSTSGTASGCGRCSRATWVRRWFRTGA